MDGTRGLAMVDALVSANAGRRLIRKSLIAGDPVLDYLAIKTSISLHRHRESGCPSMSPASFVVVVAEEDDPSAR